MLSRLKIVMLALLLISGCSKSFDDEEALRLYKGMPEPQLYQHAINAYHKKEYTEAISRLEALNVMYPFSKHAKKIQRYLIASYFKHSDYAQAAASSERYIHLYPRDPQVDYAYYMKGVANYEQQRGTFAKLFNIDASWRDPGTQWQSYKDFKQLVDRFPHSKYRDDSLKRMIYLRNQFANRELNIAKFYFERKQYVAALERAKNVVTNYQQSPQRPQAMALIEKIDGLLRLQQAKQNVAKVIRG